MRTEFCPQCGDPISSPEDQGDPEGGRPKEVHRGERPKEVHHGGQAQLCDACYLAEFDLIDAPEMLTVRICPRCGAVQKGEQWTDIGAEDYTDIAIDQTTAALSVHVDANSVEWMVEPEQIDANTILMHCYFSGVVRDRDIETTHDLRVDFARETCTRCSRIAGDYYASTVQLRAADRTPTTEETDRSTEIARTFVAEREEQGDRNAFITEINEKPEGVDIRLSNTRLGRAIAARIQREFGATVRDSQTLITEDEDGSEVYRVTYAVRLPPYPPGTIIKPSDEDPVLVTSATGNLKGVHLTTGNAYESTDSDDIRRLAHRREATETTLVAVEDENEIGRAHV